MSGLSVAIIDELHAEVGKMLEDPHGPRDILVNIGKLQAPDKATVQAALAFMRTGLFRRVAVHGNALPSLMMLTNKVVKSLGGKERVKIFRDEAPARAWLAQADEN